MTGRITVAGARYFQRILFGRAADPAEQFYLALVRQIQPTVFNTADELDEVDVTDSGYARQAIPNTGAHWTESANLTRANVEDIIFDPAEIDWGVIKYWALCELDVGGDVYVYGSLAQPVDINPLDRAIVPQGQISIAVNVLYQGD